jgi:hypothetical protein
MIRVERWRAGGDLRVVAMRTVLVCLWVATAGLAAYALFAYTVISSPGIDTHAYWLAGHLSDPYGIRPGEPDAVLYSPLFVQAMRVLALLPWPVFYGLWVAAETSAYVWLLHPLPLCWRVPALLACVPAIVLGNVYGMLGVTLVLGTVRSPWFAAAALTKVTPTGVGAIWFAARGEWRALAGLVLTCAALAGASFVVAPDLWVAWVRFLTSHTGDGAGRLVQIPLGLLLAVVAARTDRRWLLAVAWWLAMPMASVLAVQSLVALAPMVRLHRSGPGLSAGAAAAARGRRSSTRAGRSAGGRPAPSRP